jgi:hypothetical protein
MPGRSEPTEGAPGTHWAGGWVSSRASLNAVGKSKNSFPDPDRTKMGSTQKYYINVGFRMTAAIKLHGAGSFSIVFQSEDLFNIS